MGTSARFWDRIAKRYAKQAIADEASYQKKLKKTREYFRPDTEVLEIGCGSGSTAIAHAPFVKQVRATDISAAMIAIAKDKARAEGVANVSFDVCAIDDLSASESGYDVVLALSVLHLLDDREAAIDRIAGLLKPGGIFVSSTACLGDTQAWLRFVLPPGRLLGLLPMVRFFTRAELEASIVNAGFEIEHGWQPAAGKAVFIVARKTG